MTPRSISNKHGLTVLHSAASSRIASIYEWILYGPESVNL